MLKQYGWIITFVALSGLPHKLSADLSTQLCETYMVVVSQAVELRRNGIPLNIAEGAADSAYDLDINLYGFLVAAIRVAYERPDYAEMQIRNGQWLQVCTKGVRGY